MFLYQSSSRYDSGPAPSTYNVVVFLPCPWGPLFFSSLSLLMVGGEETSSVGTSF